jgi:hypothetical protein
MPMTTEPAAPPAPTPSSGRLDETAAVAARLRSEIDDLLADCSTDELEHIIESIRVIKQFWRRKA